MTGGQKNIARNTKGNVLVFSWREGKEHYGKLQSVESVFPFGS
jgi:hypothetical protein